MNDPHVKALVYDLKTSGRLYFINPDSLEHEIDLFRFTLGSDIARFEMKEHFASEGEAKRAVESFIESWELLFALENNGRDVWLEFKSAEIIDRNPSAEVQSLYAPSIQLGILVGASAEITVGRQDYPRIPTHFVATLDVQTLWNRYKHYSDGKESLATMAYFCLKMAEHTVGGNRDMAKKTLNISGKVLDTIQRLSNTRGNANTARKFFQESILKPFTAKEKHWLQTAVRKMIQRVGEHGAGAPLPKITMESLPEIE